MGELMIGLKEWEKSMDKDPQKRPFAKLQRGEDGNFSDDDLVHIMTEAIEDTAGMSVPCRAMLYLFWLSPLRRFSANLLRRCIWGE